MDADGNGVVAYVSGYREREGLGWFPASLRETRTAADGRMTVYLPEGAFRCNVIVPGQATRFGVLLESPQAREVVIAVGIANGAVVEGTLTDTAGAPVAGAHVFVESERTNERLARLTVSGSDGTYRVRGLLPGTLERVAINAAGFITVENAAPSRTLEAGARTRVDATLVRGGVLEGVVTGPDGRPLAGAHVEAHAEHAHRGLASTDRAVTDANGRYRMTHVNLGAGYLLASAPGFYEPDAKGHWYVIDGEADRKTIDVALARGIALHGRVVDTDGKPVARAAVTVQGRPSEGWWSSDFQHRALVTDESGRFTYAGLPPGKRWRLTAKTETSLSSPVDVAIEASDELEPVEIVLRPGGVIQGRVVTTNDDWSERLRAHARAKSGRSHTIPILADGTFRLTGLQPDEFEVYVVDWHMDAVSTRESVTTTWGQVVQDLALTLGPVSAIAGIVVDEDDKPVSQLHLTLDTSTPTHGRSIEAETNLRGRFVFTSVPDIGQAFTISIGSERMPGTFDVGDMNVRLVHRAKQRVHFEGTVRLVDGTPAVSGKMLIYEITPPKRGSAGDSRGYTVAIVNGAFGKSFVRDSPESMFQAEVTEVFDALGRMVSIEPMNAAVIEPGVPITFHLTTGLDLSGVVVDGEGEPVPGVRITIDMKDTDLNFHRKNMESRPDGTFWFGSLNRGKIDLRVERPPSPWIAPPALEVEAGDTDVRVTLIRGGTIRGTVLDPDGKPAANAKVTWYGPRGKSISALSGTDGRFELFPVPPEVRGSVNAMPPADAKVPLIGALVADARAGTHEIELQLSPGALVEGEVTGPDGEAIPGVVVTCFDVAKHATYHARALEKKFTIGPMPPGRYRVQAHPSLSPYVTPEPIEIDAPASGLRIVVPKGLTITGTLTGSEDLGQFSVQFMRMVAGSPVGMGGGVTSAGHFEVTLKEDHEGSLFFRDHQGTHDLYGLVEKVRPSQGPLSVELQKGLRIEGDFDAYETSEQGHVYIQASNGITLSARVSASGAFVIHGVPPGEYDLFAARSRKALLPMRGVRAGGRRILIGKP